MAVPVTFVLTSCGRFALLERTLASFFATNTYPIQRYIIIEDSGDPEVFAICERFPGVPLEIHLNRPPLRQMRSIDKAYAMVDTEFVFHCEDDWLFTKPGVIEQSITLLEAFANVCMVLPRSPGEVGEMARLPVESESGVRYRPIDPRPHHHWGGLSLNPGLRRMSHYRRAPSFEKLGSESAASAAYKRMGLRMVMLEDGGVVHIGHGQSANTLRRRHAVPRALARVRRSLVSRLQHELWLRSKDAKRWYPVRRNDLGKEP
jgi:hypothetical protein